MDLYKRCSIGYAVFVYVYVTLADGRDDCLQCGMLSFIIRPWDKKRKRSRPRRENGEGNEKI